MEEERYQHFLKQIGAQVRIARSAKGLTMQQLANDANIELRQLGRIERGEINTTVTSLKRIANSLQVTVGSFFLDEPS